MTAGGNHQDALPSDSSEEVLRSDWDADSPDPVTDGETRDILGYPVTFFDIHSTKARQFGFTTVLKNGKKFTCTGDEPFQELCLPYVEGSSWLLHEPSVSTARERAVPSV